MNAPTNICEKCGERLVECVCAVEGHVTRPRCEMRDLATYELTLYWKASGEVGRFRFTAATPHDAITQADERFGADTFLLSGVEIL